MIETLFAIGLLGPVIGMLLSTITMLVCYEVPLDWCTQHRLTRASSIVFDGSFLVFIITCVIALIIGWFVMLTR